MDITENNDSKSYLSFRIGKELFAANVKNVISILEITKITRVPKAPPYMKGVINLRGSVLPVLDTRIKFNVGNTEFDANTCILVLELIEKNETIKLGIIVDSVQEVLHIEDNEIQPPPKLGIDFNSEIIIGMTKQDDTFIMILDVAQFFNVDITSEVA